MFSSISFPGLFLFLFRMGTEALGGRGVLRQQIYHVVCLRLNHIEFFLNTKSNNRTENAEENTKCGSRIFQ